MPKPIQDAPSDVSQPPKETEDKPWWWCAAMLVSEYLYEPLLVPTSNIADDNTESSQAPDDFHSKSRKAAVVASLLFVPFLVAAIGVWSNALVSNPDSSLPIGLCLAGACVSLVTICVVYIVARSWREVPIWITDILLSCGVIFACILTISMPAFPTDLTMQGLAILCVWSRSPRAPFFVALCTLNYVMFMYNVSWRTSEWPVALLPYSYAGRPGEQLFLRAGFCLITAPLLLLAGNAMIKQYQASVEALQRGVDLAQSVAVQLVSYDTAGVRRTADVFENMTTEGDTATHELILSFRQMADNLDQYRPYLPNWVLAGIDGNLSEDDEDNEQDRRRLKDADQEDSMSQGPSHAKQKRDKARCDSTNDTSRSVASNASSNYSNRVTASEHAQPQTKKQNQPDLLFPSFHGKITVVVVDFGVTRNTAATAEAFRSARPAIYEAIIGKIHRLASFTGGALHSLVCDRCIVSWNATNRVGVPELKAARFLCRLNSAIKEINEDHRRRLASTKTQWVGRAFMNGIAVTGRSKCQLAGGRKAQAFTLHPKWLRALRTLSTFSRTTGKILVDETTRFALSSEYVVRGYDAIMCHSKTYVPKRRLPTSSPLEVPAEQSPAQGVHVKSPANEEISPDPETVLDSQQNIDTKSRAFFPPDLEPVAVFEIFPKVFNGEGDEWMYELQDQDRSADNILTSTLTRLVAHKFGHTVDINPEQLHKQAEDARTILQGLLDQKEEICRELPEHREFPEESIHRLLSRAEAILCGKLPWRLPSA